MQVRSIWCRLHTLRRLQTVACFLRILGWLFSARWALENSDMVRDLCTSNRLTLTENKRSDQILYDFCTVLSKRPLADALAEARTRFPVTDEIPDTTLVIPHGRRRYLNVKRNVSETPIHSVYFRAPATGATGNGPQNMFLWPGLSIVGGDGPFKK